ncbi:GMC family oxidoreductase [Teichococcus cervicalis]|uniref:GMC oxidoreductase n=1 Tax=Pseudoroseomonas cervicalis ATCC 49957 TaxID=525371 RepID=D5RSZ6_9PROT|nr:GMC family oxidoreductase N-terminal domain-containing protein [Pseudoroseomonas cervicalis]EFH09564.1 GMC oxidoreductase [Pseudoroseomonas cervicalis ATCC 49957]
MSAALYDRIIIGAGSAGCVLAHRLSADPACRVLLLEAGREPPLASRIPSDWPTMFNTRVDWGYHTEPQAGCRGRRIFWPRGKMLGGSGSLNAMIYIRGVASDYDGWAAQGCPEWGWAQVLPAFLASEDNARHPAGPHHGQGGPLPVGEAPYRDPLEEAWLAAARAAGLPANDDFNGPEQEGVGFFQLTVRQGERHGTAAAYLRPALARPNLALEAGVTVTRLLLEGHRVRGVEYLREGRPCRAMADQAVVLAAGAIGSPHLLMLSGIGPADALRAAGVTPRHDLPGVGQNLQDHINIPVCFHMEERRGIGAMTEAELEASLARWQATRDGPRSSPWVAAGGFARTRPGLVAPDIQLYGAASAHQDYGRHLATRPGMTLHATLQRPNSRGEIRLRSADPLEAPAIDPRYFSSDPSGEDLATLAEGIALNRRIAAQAPLSGLLTREAGPGADCRDAAELRAFIRGHCTTLYHPAGTCRMGRDALAVVEPDTMRLRGLEGLYVADASVFPVMVSGNTNAPTIMVAERAAAMIAGAGVGAPLPAGAV